MEGSPTGKQVGSPSTGMVRIVGALLHAEEVTLEQSSDNLRGTSQRPELRQGKTVSLGDVMSPNAGSQRVDKYPSLQNLNTNKSIEVYDYHISYM